jgi:hypothetical protein
MTQPSSKRFVMEDGYLANKEATDTAIYDEQIARQEGDDSTLSLANSHSDTLAASIRNNLDTERPYPNYLINGGFDVWQRGTTLTLLSATLQTGYIADRWKCSATGVTGASYTFSRVEENPRVAPSMGRYDMQITQNNNITGVHYAVMQQVLETSDVYPMAGTNSNVMFSAYIYSNINANVDVSILTSTSADSSTPTEYVTGSYTVTAGEWRQVSISTPLAILSKLTVGVQIKTSLSTAGDYIKVSSAKLEGIGFNEEPTAFVRNGGSFASELAACQRYYYRTPTPAVGYPWASGYNTTTLLSTFFVQFPVHMRVAPSVLEQSGTAAHYAITNTAGAAVACSAVPTHVSASTRGARIATTVATAGTAGFGSMLLANNTAAYLGWSAEIL